MKHVGSCLCGCAVIAFFCGCLPSVHPFYTKERVIELKQVAGSWQMVEEDGVEPMLPPWTFGSNTIETIDEDGEKGMLKATYFKVGPHVFLDTLADEPADGVSEWWALHLMPIHQLCKVKLAGDRLILEPIDFSWMTKAIEAGTVTLRHEVVSGTVLFTCTPQDWADFLLKNSTNVAVFSGDVQYRFRRPLL